MKKVKLISADWNNPNQPNWIKNILIVGDALPEINGIYTVSLTFMDDQANIKAYQLEEFDYSAYFAPNEIGAFRAERFEVVENDYAPNSIVKIGDVSFLAQKTKYMVECDDDFLNHLDLEIQYVKRDDGHDIQPL